MRHSLGIADIVQRTGAKHNIRKGMPARPRLSILFAVQEQTSPSRSRGVKLVRRACLAGGNVVPANDARRIFGMERLWMAVSRVSPPFTVQLVVESDPSTPLPSRASLQAAIASASRANPGVRLRRVGHLGWARWVVGGAPPPLREVDGTRWSGRDEAGAPFLQTPLTPSGPTVEVLRVEGPVPRIVFRGSHCVVDGRGLLTFAEDVFAVLRGERPQGSRLDIVDRDVALAGGAQHRKPEPPSQAMPTGMPERVAPGTPMPWRRVRYTGSTRSLLPRLAIAVYAASRAYTDGPISVEIPVDLRRHLPEGTRSTANLTGTARVGVSDLVNAPDAIGVFIERLRAQSEHGEAMAPIIDTEFMRHVPIWSLTRAVRRVREKELNTGTVALSAMLSNFGRYPLSRLSGGGFEARSWFWVPSGGPVVPLFILVTGDESGVDLSCGLSPELATRGRLDGLVDGILKHLDTASEGA